MSFRHTAARFQRSHRWFVFAFLGLIGAASCRALLQHVMVKNRIVEIGRRQHAAECEIADLERDIRGLNLKIEESLSRTNLMNKLAARRTRLRPIQPGSAVILSTSHSNPP